MKRQLPKPPFYPLEDLASEWGCSLAMLRSHSAFGEGPHRLLIEQRGRKGARIEGVTPSEKARFESLGAGATRKPAGGLAGTERTSLLALIGVLAAAWCGCDEAHEKHPYTLLASLEEFAARQAVPMVRGDDTNARLLREAFEVLRAHGYRGGSPRAEVRSEAVKIGRESASVREDVAMTNHTSSEKGPPRAVNSR